MTRDELIEKMARAGCRATCGYAECEGFDCCQAHPMSLSVYRHQKKMEAALTAIESVIPVSGILSGAYEFVGADPNTAKAAERFDKAAVEYLKSATKSRASARKELRRIVK